MTAPYHQNQQYANQTLNWLSCDSPENWIKNQRFNFEKLKNAGWLEAQPIVYQYNSHGFRCSEFDPRPSGKLGLAFGCSNTEALGQYSELGWVNQLSSALELTIWNLGVTGAAMDTIYRLMYYWVPMLRPDFVVLLCPPSLRYEILDTNNNWNIVNVHSVEADDLHAKHYFLSDENSSLNFEKNLMAIQQICHQQNVPLVFLQSDHDLIEDNKARDLQHPGSDSHADLAQKFAALLQSFCL